MEQHIFAFSLIIEGTTEKVLQLIMPLKSTYNRNFGFIKQKIVSCHTADSKPIKHDVNSAVIHPPLVFTDDTIK